MLNVQLSVLYFSYMCLRICISEFAAEYLGISSNVSQNYSFTYIELFRYFYRNYSVIYNGIFKCL
jgi:hypothetical protein